MAMTMAPTLNYKERSTELFPLFGFFDTYPYLLTIVERRIVS